MRSRATRRMHAPRSRKRWRCARRTALVVRKDRTPSRVKEVAAERRLVSVGDRLYRGRASEPARVEIGRARRAVERLDLARAAAPDPGRRVEQQRPGPVSCTSPSACTAIGHVGLHSDLLIERWNGTKWSIQRLPDTSIELSDVSCTAQALCTAVGYQVGMGSPGVIAARWSSGKWSISEAPRSYFGVDINAVSCRQ